jgi:ABC-type multidrug transport system ATPase subunit
MDEAERCGRVGYLYLSNLLTIGTPEELKRLPSVTPADARRLEIVANDSARLLAQLRKQPGVREATIFGQAVHALVDADRSLQQLGLTGLSVREAEANLEDVFVTLSRQAAA